MRRRFCDDRGVARLARPLLWLTVLALLLGRIGPGWADDTPAAPPPPAPPAVTTPIVTTPAKPAPARDMMSSADWLGRITMKLESEAVSDVTMLPDTSAALAREWRSLDRNGSALGTLINLGWVVLAGIIAWCAEWAAARGASRRLRRALQAQPAGPTVKQLLLLLLCDLIGVAVFAEVFIYSRHWLMGIGVTAAMIILSANVLIRWRIAMAVFSVMLRPRDPLARLIELPDREARRLGRFFSASVLAIVVLIGFGRYGLMDEDSGAPHIIVLIVALAVCGIYTLIVFRARGVGEALIRGCSGGLIGALRARIARAWLTIGLSLVAGLLVFFVFGLSLGLLSYYHAVVETLGVLLVLLVLERLAERGWHDEAAAGGVDRLVGQSLRRVLCAVVLLIAAMTLTLVWVDAIEPSAAATEHALYSATAAVGTLFVAYIIWELTRLGIDRHLQNVGGGPKLPGDEDEDAAPGSRLQTMLPMLRAAFGVLIAVVVTLIVLSHLGIDTAPLIAGAGVFGLAISFGAQSLVRDVISGLFYLWDDAFRVGEYIDTGRLKGTVEAIGIRSLKVRHHNGPLHTIPYGQLGAVTNQSRDFATIKFNLRLEPGTDIELVRKTAKKIGLDMQENPEIAAEVMLPLKLQGIAEVTDNAVVFRFKFTARPVKPSWIQREYMKTMYRMFAEKGIIFASGALTLHTLPARGDPFAAAEADPAALTLAEAAVAVPSRVA
jgi:moderate conductance mechanosensitive channel